MKKKVTVLAVCALILLLTILWSGSPLRRDALTPRVTVSSAKACNIVTSIYFKGNISSESTKEIFFAEPAQVTAVYAGEGDRVQAGDTILTARTEDTPYSILPGFENEAVAVFQELYGGSRSSAQTIYTMSRDGLIEVKSPISGVLSELPLQTGTAVSARTLCAVIYDPDDMKMRASVPEVYVQDLEPGLACKITGDAFRGRIYTGRIEKIMPYATTSQNLNGKGETVVEVLISIDSPDEALRSGYSARAEILTDRRDRAVTVPYEAVGQDEENREYVFVCTDGRVRRRLITTGTELEKTVEVTSGLSAGEYVVTAADRELSDGMAVKAVLR